MGGGGNNTLSGLRLRMGGAGGSDPRKRKNCILKAGKHHFVIQFYRFQNIVSPSYRHVRTGSRLTHLRICRTPRRSASPQAFDPFEHGAAPPAPNGRLPPFEPFGRTLGFGPRHSHVAAHVAARISASRLRQLLEPRTMEREEPRDYFRPHLARNIPHSHSPGQPIRALIRGRSHCAPHSGALR